MKRCSISIRSVLMLAVLCMTISPGTESFASAKRSTARLDVPQVKLIRDDGVSVSLPNELNDGRPVVLSFIFTTCTSICPLITNTLAQVQNKLGADKNRVHILSISIDPEEDTPSRLKAYAKKHHAGPGWNHYTGAMPAIIKTATAFGVYRGNKMAHAPVIFSRKSPNESWTRFDGFASADEILTDMDEVAASK